MHGSTCTCTDEGSTREFGAWNESPKATIVMKFKLYYIKVLLSAFTLQNVAITRFIDLNSELSVHLEKIEIS
jgi:hypothetical protein